MMSWLNSNIEVERGEFGKGERRIFDYGCFTKLGIIGVVEEFRWSR